MVHTSHFHSSSVGKVKHPTSILPEEKPTKSSLAKRVGLFATNFIETAILVVPNTIGNALKNSILVFTISSSTLLSVVTFGNLAKVFPRINRLLNTEKLKTDLASVLPSLFISTLNFVSPEEFTDPYYTSYDKSLFESGRKCIRGFADTCASKESNFIKRHFVSRLGYATLGVVAVATRVTELGVGILAATVSYLTLGRIHRIDRLAYANLGIFALVFELSISLRGSINPSEVLAPTSAQTPGVPAVNLC